MPDSSIPRAPQPSGWGEAFAALPAESPPADAWASVARRLPTAAARRGRLDRRAGFALAAAVAALAVGVVLTRPSPIDAPATRTATVVQRSAPRVADAPGPAKVTVDSSADTAARATGPSALATATRPVPLRGAMRPQPVMRTPRLVAERPRLASHADDGDRATTAPSTALDDLRAESARLEALAALARNDRMASAPAMVLAGEAEDRVRLIDDALSQPALGEAERIDLWTRRVAALRELAGVEGTTRWLAANGESLQGAIALVD
ncbi:hypothetical protein [Lysobacter xanthus]